MEFAKEKEKEKSTKQTNKKNNQASAWLKVLINSDFFFLELLSYLFYLSIRFVLSKSLASPLNLTFLVVTSVFRVVTTLKTRIRQVFACSQMTECRLDLKFDYIYDETSQYVLLKNYVFCLSLFNKNVCIQHLLACNCHGIEIQKLASENNKNYSFMKIAFPGFFGSQHEAH